MFLAGVNKQRTTDLNAAPLLSILLVWAQAHKQGFQD